jgi:predicted ATPase/class 3 adenylate cyclase/Tfp pilus assembly protein PilF
MRELPEGTVTILFTDIEGSTRLLLQSSDGFTALLEAHRELLRRAFQRHGGIEVDTQGDAFLVVFRRAPQALLAAAEAQQRLADHPWPENTSVRVRMGIHTGAPVRTQEGYAGLALHQGARIMSAGHGGQVLFSQATADLVRGDLPTGMVVRDLGVHRLKDLPEPEHLYQLEIDGLPREFPSLRTLGDRGNNLPTPATRLIGREELVQRVVGFLRRDDIRLATLTGPGGCGKSRLAIQAASELLPDCPDGVSWVALASISTPGLVVSAIASALGVREGHGESLEASLAKYLGTRRRLLLLDNFEQILGAAPLITNLLAVCPGLKVLVTSRAALRLTGEQEILVPPLELPDLARDEPLERLLHSPAVTLFVERARSANPDFSVTVDAARDVARICTQLDGLPLGIELAAARTKLLSPHALLGRMAQRLGVLTGGARDLPVRHQSLRDTIAWSYDLLSLVEQAVFRRFGVFVGGSTLEALEEVCPGDGVSSRDILDSVDSLLTGSLLTISRGGAADDRISMLVTIREFALERLEASGEGARVRERHARWAARRAETLAAELYGHQQITASARLEQEHENIRAALDWLSEHRRDRALSLAASVWPFWRMHNHLSEGRGYLERLLASAGDAVDARTRAAALLGLGNLTRDSGRHDQASELLHESERWAKAAGDVSLQGRVRTVLGWVAWFQGQQNRARDWVRESADLLRTTDDRWGLADALHMLGHIQIDAGDLDAAHASFEESLSLFRGVGDGWNLAQPLKDLGLIAARRGDYAAARPMYEESLGFLLGTGDKVQLVDSLNRVGELDLLIGAPEAAQARFESALAIARDVDNKTLVVETLMRFVELAEGRGKFTEARRLLDEALTLARSAQHQRLIAGIFHNLAYVELQEGQCEKAAAMLAGALRIHKSLDRELGIVQNMLGFGALACDRGQFELAACLFGAAEAWRERLGQSVDPFDRIELATGNVERLQRTRSALGETFDRAWAEGRALSRDDALASAATLAPPAAEAGPR